MVKKPKSRSKRTKPKTREDRTKEISENELRKILKSCKSMFEIK